MSKVSKSGKIVIVETQRAIPKNSERIRNSFGFFGWGSFATYTITNIETGKQRKDVPSHRVTAVVYFLNR
ncbi:hypothetical protein OAU00_03415 [Saprospiraceae bacterium]|nr:hypothetical protein [Saprospiraceae bacterium]